MASHLVGHSASVSKRRSGGSTTPIGDVGLSNRWGCWSWRTNPIPMGTRLPDTCKLSRTWGPAALDYSISTFRTEMAYPCTSVSKTFRFAEFGIIITASGT